MPATVDPLSTYAQPAAHPFAPRVVPGTPVVETRPALG